MGPDETTSTHTSTRVRQGHASDVMLLTVHFLSPMEMYVFLLQPGLAALTNLAANFVAGWLLLSEMLDLSYLTPPLPLLVFAVRSDEGRELAGKK